MLKLPATQLCTVGGAGFEYVAAGTGRPSVVLINGSGGPIEGWYKVFSVLSDASTTFAYNRPGLGGSTRPIRPQTVGVMVDELRQVLLAVPVPQPWVLVGHSFGGLIANLFARLHPSDIAGVVLLEATAPQDLTQLKQHESTLQRGLAWAARRLLPLNPKHETLHTLTSASEVARAPAFPPLPLRVVTGHKPAMAWATNRDLLALRAKHQKSLASLSPLGVHVQAQQSGHFPQFSGPELVISAIEAVLADTR